MVHRKTCRLCNAGAFELVLPICPSALGDAFVTREQLHVPQERYPLNLQLCKICGHVQTLDTIEPEKLFLHYAYRTSSSLGNQAHFQSYADDLAALLKIDTETFAVEIGSNDGILLKALKAHGARVLGVEPSQEIAAEARLAGIPTVPKFFDAQLAVEILAEHGQARIVSANNVFAHVDNPADIVKGVNTLLAPDGVFVFEVGYILDMLDRMLFDTIHHEHASYHALTPLVRFFATHDLELFDALRTSAKGGSIRGFVQHAKTGRHEKSARLKEYLAEEERRELMGAGVYYDFMHKIERTAKETQRLIDGVKQAGGVVAGYGASDTTTTLLHQFELGSRLDFLLDDSPAKQGKFSPGFHIPVFPSSHLMETKVDLVVILAWVYADPIIKRNEAYLAGGGQFLIPLPTPKIVAPELVL